MLFYEQPTDPWTPYDFKLLKAYQILQDETCPKCGHPVWLCRTSSNRVQFKVRSAVCQADRALRAAEDNRRDKKDRADGKERREWGKFYYIQPFTPPNVEGGLPTREEFYEEMALADGVK
jgi:predicted  nucleic acid-binding Zn-ribbon protein